MPLVDLPIEPSQHVVTTGKLGSSDERCTASAPQPHQSVQRGAGDALFQCDQIFPDCLSHARTLGALFEEIVSEAQFGNDVRCVCHRVNPSTRSSTASTPSTQTFQQKNGQLSGVAPARRRSDRLYGPLTGGVVQ